MNKDNDVAIRVHDLHKSFEFSENKKTSIKHFFVHLGKKQKKHKQKVLDGIDFEIKKGEFFGIVGRNGSGKSTLLKILAGVYTPDSGAVEVNGNLTPFIELGVGFNPELSGRDNVYLSASLLGYTRKQVDEMYSDIVAFAELEEHMDKKLKNYSSGMQVRLAFSIAIKAKNDILIFDEVLAVGDAAFQEKCLNIFEEYRRNKQTVVLVTHNMDQIRKLCTRALLLSDGIIKKIGSVKEIADKYSLINLSNENQKLVVEKVSKIINIKIINKKSNFLPGDWLKLKISWDKKVAIKRLGVAVHRNNGDYVFGSTSREFINNENNITHELELNLGPDRYYLTIVASGENDKIIEVINLAWKFAVIDDDRQDVGGQVRLKHKYE